MHGSHRLSILSVGLALWLVIGCASAPPKVDTATEVPWQAYWYFARGDLLEAQGRAQEALEEYLHALKYDPWSLDLRLATARVLIRMGGWKEAAGILERTVQQESQSVEAQLLLGDCYLQLRRPQEAETRFQKVLQLNPGHIPARKRLAALYEWKQDYTRANDLYRELLSLVKYPENMHLRRAENFIKMQHYRRAQEEYLQALEICPDLVEAHGGLARTYELLGQPEQAVEYYRAAIERFPQRPALQSQLAELFVRLGRPQEAVEEYRRLAEADTSDETALRHLGLLLYHTEQFAQAEDVFRRLALLSPGDPAVHLYLGRALAGQDRMDEAAEQFRLTIALDQQTADGWISLAIVYLQAEDHAGAERILKRAVLKAPDEARLWHLLGVTHLRLEKYRLAMGDLERARSLDEENIAILRDLANSYERAGYFQKSVQLFGEILERRPDDHWALNYLGYMLANAGVQLDRAERLVERALRLDPQNPYYLDSMGWIYFRLGQVDLAERYLLEAAQLSPEQAVIQEHLGDLYERMGRTGKAGDFWRRALELAPGDEQIQQKLERLGLPGGGESP